MKKIHIIILIVLTGIFSCCEQKVSAPNFDVAVASIDKIMLEPSVAGQDCIPAYDVTFRFSGDPEIVVLFSGERGKEYAYRNRYSKNVKTTVQFSTEFNDGDLDNTLSVLVSSDFVPDRSGDYVTINLAYSRDGVAAARWNDITGNFYLPGNSLTKGFTAAGEVDITPFVTADYPVFLAFRYDADRSGGARGGRWNISNFKLTNYDPDDNAKSELISDVINAYWLPVNMMPKDSTQWARSALTVTSGTSASVDGNFSKAPKAQTYLISKAFYPNKVKTDKGTVVKLIQEMKDEHIHRYTNPTGNYKATFVATNTLHGESIQVVKEINLNFE